MAGSRRPLFWAIVIIVIAAIAYVGYGRWYGRVSASRCGDGVISFGEGCDDRNMRNGDGCNEKCKVEPNWTCAGAPSACSERVVRCGDGVIAPEEACDDGNAFANDGCSDSCQIEPEYLCVGVPSVCKKV
ncbi:MAG: DUF4215 domain-containing protein [Candidatus Peribacteraceae bacterium]|jgi:cysteine-rich repeat protein